MQPHGGEVKKAILFPAGWKTRGEDRETRLWTRTGKEGLARFTSTVTRLSPQVPLQFPRLQLS